MICFIFWYWNYEEYCRVVTDPAGPNQSKWLDRPVFTDLEKLYKYTDFPPARMGGRNFGPRNFRPGLSARYEMNVRVRVLQFYRQKKFWSFGPDFQPDTKWMWGWDAPILPSKKILVGPKVRAEIHVTLRHDFPASFFHPFTNISI